MEWGILEEDVFYKALVDTCIYQVAGLNDVFQHHTTLNDNQRTYLSTAHAHACHDDGHDGFLVHFRFVSLFSKQFHEVVHLSVRTKAIKEVAYIFLEKYDKTDDSHRYKFVHDAAQEPHFQYLAHDKPHDNEYHDADEDVERT